MKTYFDCIPCFFKQVIGACDMLDVSEEVTKGILDKVALKIPELSLTATPPEMIGRIQRILKEETMNPDPYKALKATANAQALKIYPDLKKKIEEAQDPLLAAVQLAIAGNIIDYGAMSGLDLSQEIEAIINREDDAIQKEDSKFFAYADFVKELEKAESLLYLLDNTGEVIFDKLLLEEILKAHPGLKIYCAVRGGPILNDCTIEDALWAGLDKLSTVISSGLDLPGTILASASKEFRDIWKGSDLIISKGQGNFESLSEVGGNIFFLFIVKCRVLTENMGCNLRDVFLYRSQPFVF